MEAGRIAGEDLGSPQGVAPPAWRGGGCRWEPGVGGGGGAEAAEVGGLSESDPG